MPVTRVPDPTRRSTSPSLTNLAIAASTVFRATRSSFASTLDAGINAPTGNDPFSIDSRSCVYTCRHNGTSAASPFRATRIPALRFRAALSGFVMIALARIPALVILPASQLPDAKTQRREAPRTQFGNPDTRPVSDEKKKLASYVTDGLASLRLCVKALRYITRHFHSRVRHSLRSTGSTSPHTDAPSPVRAPTVEPSS